MVTEEKLRERFEEWAKRVWHPVLWLDSVDRYHDARIQAAFEAWQAAEAAGFARGVRESTRAVSSMPTDDYGRITAIEAGRIMTNLIPNGKEQEHGEDNN